MKLNLVEDIETIPAVAKFNEHLSGRSVSKMEALTPIQLKRIIQDCGLAKLLLEKERGGLGYDLTTTMHVVQYVGEKAPSLGVMLCMHYHVVGVVALLPDSFPYADFMLEKVGRDNCLVASAFAEGTPGQNIFVTHVTAVVDGDSVLINGHKKPCSMSNVADFYLVSVENTQQQTGLALIDGTDSNITRTDFWPTELLASSDSHRVDFNNLVLPAAMVSFTSDELMEEVFCVGMTLFTLMINASYTGVATALAKKLPADTLQNKKSLYIDIYGRLVQSYNSGYAIAHRLQQGENVEHLMEQSLVARFLNQILLKEVGVLVKENCGTFEYFADPEFAYLVAVCDLIAFHPYRRNTFENL